MNSSPVPRDSPQSWGETLTAELALKLGEKASTRSIFSSDAAMSGCSHHSSGLP